MADNLKLYNKFREVPKDAQKTITGGRLNGFTDINPMWRIKTLTDAFGACGHGWYFKKTEERIVPCGDKGEVTVFVDVELYYRTEDAEWSEPVYGTGGSMLVTMEKSGLRVDDEAFKKAYTDAQSVACKALGIGADIYWQKDSTKYPTASTEPTTASERDDSAKLKPERTEEDSAVVSDAIDKAKIEILQIAQAAGRDEAAVARFAEKLILDNFNRTVKYKDMNLGFLITVKNALIKKIDAENAK